MEFDKNKGFCDGLYVRDGGCQVTFHSLTHTHDGITLKNCKRCSCPSARSYRKKYSEEKIGIIE